MATIKSAKKRDRQSVGRKARNKIVRTQLRNAVKKVLESVESGESAEASLREAHSNLAKAASKGVIHSNTASRKASRLARRVNRAAASAS
ncbi:MAG: 30S ribosomal protein S20 [Nitrospinota bacterium]|nr:30S ribosomal protein S20 [Nitrospinota bacterium]